MANEKQLIDPSGLIRSLKAMACEYDAVALHAIVNALKEEPAVDAVEVVRCKDCKHYIATGSGKAFGCEIFCGCYGRPYPTEPDDYCSYGEREASHGAGG